MNRRTSILLALTALAAAATGGCGQKGPLFLPEEKLEEMERKREQRDDAEQPKKTGRLEPAAGARTTA